MGWGTAGLRALLIVAYFFLITVWLPSFVLRIGTVTRASSTTQGLLGTGIWAIGFGAGIWLLRTAQTRGAI